MEYRCEATSALGFVQLLASNYLPHGYWFYTTGTIPISKNPRWVDEKLIAKYGINLSRAARARRKAAGLANLHYLRYERFFVLLATHGQHPFFAEEGEQVRDIRRVPLHFEGYSISFKKGAKQRKHDATKPAAKDEGWHSRIQICRERYLELRAYFQDIACHRSAEALAAMLWNLPFEPYAPVRRQLLRILRVINVRRQAAGYDKLPYSVLRYRRQIVKPYGGEGLEPKLSSEAESHRPLPLEGCEAMPGNVAWHTHAEAPRMGRALSGTTDY
jgi:hypothetical protein